MLIKQIWNEKMLRAHREKIEGKMKCDLFEAGMVFANIGLCFLLFYLLFL